MNKFIKLIFVFLIINGCAYEPILLKKRYDFNFTEIYATGENKINEIIKNKLFENTNSDHLIKYKLNINSEKNKEIVSSSREGDPSIYKISIKLKYSLIENNQIILNNEILKQTTYNNIKDKFELLKYEEDMIKNLSEKFADDILISISTLLK